MFSTLEEAGTTQESVVSMVANIKRLEPDMKKTFKRPAPIDRQLAREAKAIVALSFRNGPIEDIHAGKPCPTCAEDAAYSRISDDEMKTIIKNAVNHVYLMLALKQTNPTGYEAMLTMGDLYTARWDDPDPAAIRS
jgi:hypothetical protein